MTEADESKVDQSRHDGGSPCQTILGLPTSDLAGLSVDEIVGDPVAITMLMHYYKQLVDENNSLRNDLNTLKTYVEGYRSKKLDASIGAPLQVLATILIAFGVNLLTADSSTAASWLLLIAGIITALVGLYFSLREDRAK